MNAKTDAKTALSLTVNGRRYDIAVEPRRNLADALREDCATMTCARR